MIIFTIISKSEQPSKSLGYVYYVESKNPNVTQFYEFDFKRWGLDPQIGMQFSYAVDFATDTVTVKVIK